ncbi:MAG: hypothetical protein IJ242_06715, partial [Clostridia bacterium]|nr:hypothetical protein [Clostridia bacterium]
NTFQNKKIRPSRSKFSPHPLNSDFKFKAFCQLSSAQTPLHYLPLLSRNPKKSGDFRRNMNGFHHPRAVASGDLGSDVGGSGDGCGIMGCKNTFPKIDKAGHL